MTTSDVCMETPPSSPARDDDVAEEAAAELGRRPGGHLVSDLTPVIRNSWYLDAAIPPRASPAKFPGLTDCDDVEEDFMLISPHSSVSRTLLPTTSLPFKAPKTESQGGPTVHLGTEVDFKNRHDAIELGKYSSFQGVGRYEKRVAAPPTAIPSSPRDHQYRPFLRDRHGVEEMADADEVDAIFKSPRRQKGDSDNTMQQPNMISPGPTPPQLQGQRHEEGPDPCLHLARPYPVDERDWSIPSIRLANRVGQSSSSGHPMDSFASYTDLSEYTAEDDLDGSLDSLEGTSILFPDIFQRKNSSELLADRIPQTVYSQDVCDHPPPLGSPTLLPEASDAMNSFLERVQGVSIENNGEECRPAIDAAPLQDPWRRRDRCRGREGAALATEWLRELRDRSPTNPIAEAASSKFFGGGSAPPTAKEEGGEGGELGAPRRLCRSSTAGA